MSPVLIGAVQGQPSARRRGCSGCAPHGCRVPTGEAGVGFAWLVSEREMIPGFRHLGRRESAGKLTAQQWDRPAAFTSNRVMTFDIAMQAPSVDTIDLNGPTWQSAPVLAAPVNRVKQPDRTEYEVFVRY